MRLKLIRFTRETFSSLSIRNYRLYFIGQAVSLCGTWMQTLAQSWLVLRLTGSGVALGMITALQFLPILLLAPYGGVVADRFSKRRLLFATQAAQAVLALALGIAVVTGTIQLWMVYVFAALLGLVNALDNPTRQSFVHELVGPDAVGNAVALNSTEINLCRVIGPALAGVLIASVGLGMCFLINAASFVAVLAGIAMMDGAGLHRSAPVRAAKGQLREGFAYVLRVPLIRDVLLMMAVVGTLTYEFNVTLPLLVKFTFHADAGTLALLMGAMGVGAGLGGIVTARNIAPRVGALTRVSFAFAAATALVAVSPTEPVAVAAMLLVGAASVRFTTLCNTTLQVASEPRMRGRVMALWSVAFLGSTFVGAPVVGWFGQHLGPRWGLGVGAVAALAAGLYGLYAQRANAASPVREQAVEETP